MTWPQLVQLVPLEPEGPVSSQIRKYTDHLPAGARVRLMVGTVPAHNLTSVDWYRDDVVWQIETDQPNILAGWDARLKELAGQ